MGTLVVFILVSGLMGVSEMASFTCQCVTSRSAHWACRVSRAGSSPVFLVAQDSRDQGGSLPAPVGGVSASLCVPCGSGHHSESHWFMVTAPCHQSQQRGDGLVGWLDVFVPSPEPSCRLVGLQRELWPWGRGRRHHQTPALEGRSKGGGEPIPQPLSCPLIPCQWWPLGTAGARECSLRRAAPLSLPVQSQVEKGRAGSGSGGRSPA